MINVSFARFAALLALLLVLAACTGGDDASSDASEGDVASEAPVVSGDDQASETAAEDDGGRGPTLEAMSAPTVMAGDIGAAGPSDLRTESDDGGDAISFTDIAADPAVGLSFSRQHAQRYATALEIWQAAITTPVTPMDAALWPSRPQGTSGVALFDADGDGDLDIYVTNAAGTPNSLFISKFADTGSLSFTEDAVAAGVDNTADENTGVCAGDVDNDGDTDLFVVAHQSPNRLFLGNGDGTFTTAPGMPTAASVGGSSCALGDVTGDGLLDVAVGHAYDLTRALALLAEPLALNIPNELLIQQADGSFVDEADPRGMLALQVVPEGAATITWGIAMVDFDADGDLDIFQADDQGALRPSQHGGTDRGVIQILTNDGAGSFTAVDAGQLVAGANMGFTFSDLNCDGAMDMLGANFGDYGLPALGEPYDLGDYATRWWLGDGSGGFDSPGVGDLGTTPFTWGGVSEDFDNDGDPDLILQGGLDLSLYLDLSNPGTYLSNQGCSADFERRDVFSVDHRSRMITGTAAGDLDGDGFVDVVTVSNVDIPEDYPAFPLDTTYGLDTDGTAFFTSRFTPNDQGMFTYNNVEFDNGSLVVEINSGNENASLAVQAVGTVGLTDGAVASRSGIGAIVTVIPEGGMPSSKPVQGGTGYLSSDAATVYAGLGSATTATVEVLWPGGTRNRVYDVPAGEVLVVPEIPCSYDNTEKSVTEYTACVSSALADLADAGIVDDDASDALLAGALRAREDG